MQPLRRRDYKTTSFYCVAWFAESNMILFLQRILILDVNLFKTAQVKVFVRHIILYFYEVIINFTILVDFDKLSEAFAKFPFYGCCNLRSSPDPNMLSVAYHNSCC